MLRGAPDAAPGAALVFRVGQADETLPRRGLTHLVEHLVLSPHTPGPGVDGTVDQLATTFVFEGEGAADRLLAAAAALVDLPVDRLEVERQVLSVESDRHSAAPEALVAEAWYGARGPGLVAFEEFGLRSVTAEDLAAHACAWFTRGNATLVLVGGVDVPGLALPAGDRRAAPVPVRRVLETLPAAVPGPTNPLALGSPLPDTPVGALLSQVLEHGAWRALRHQRGLAYDVRVRWRPVNADGRLLALVTDVPERDAGSAARVLVEEVRRLAAGDLHEGELAEARRPFEEVVAQLEALPFLLRIASSELVRGAARDPDEVVAELRAVTADEVVAAATDLAGRMLLLCPEGAAPEDLLPVIDPYGGEPVDGRRHKRRVAPRNMTAADLVVGDDGVSLLRDGDAVTVRYEECAAAVREIGGAVSLIGTGGQYVTVDPGDVRDGDEAVEAVLRRVDPEVVVALDERSRRVEETPGRGLRAAWVGDAPQLLAPLLARDEQVRHVAEATQGLRGGALAVTDRRILFVARLLSEHREEIPLTAITGLRVRKNPLYAALSIDHARGTSKFTFLTVSRLKETSAAIRDARTTVA